jgi:hypothetical protein
VSRALRELAKRNPEAVRAFLPERGQSLAALVRIKVGNTLETGLKNPGKKAAAL